jgi:hypothetical protein
LKTPSSTNGGGQLSTVELILGGLADGHDDPCNYSVEQGASKQEQ